MHDKIAIPIECGAFHINDDRWPNASVGDRILCWAGQQCDRLRIVRRYREHERLAMGIAVRRTGNNGRIAQSAGQILKPREVEMKGALTAV